MIEWFKVRIVREWILKNGREKSPQNILTKMIVVVIVIVAIFFITLLSIISFF